MLESSGIDGVSKERNKLNILEKREIISAFLNEYGGPCYMGRVAFFFASASSKWFRMDSIRGLILTTILSRGEGLGLGLLLLM